MSRFLPFRLADPNGVESGCPYGRLAGAVGGPGRAYFRRASQEGLRFEAMSVKKLAIIATFLTHTHIAVAAPSSAPKFSQAGHKSQLAGATIRSDATNNLMGVKPSQTDN